MDGGEFSFDLYHLIMHFQINNKVAYFELRSKLIKFDQPIVDQPN